jgi:hypothetical protein
MRGYMMLALSYQYVIPFFEEVYRVVHNLTMYSRQPGDLLEINDW